MNGLDAGLVGIWLLVASVVAIVIEGAIAAVWSVRVSRKASAVNARMARERAQLQADVERLRASVAEMEVLWRPYGRLLRWLRHPITIALLQSYARRRAAAR